MVEDETGLGGQKMQTEAAEVPVSSVETTLGKAFYFEHERAQKFSCLHHGIFPLPCLQWS